MRVSPFSNSVSRVLVAAGALVFAAPLAAMAALPLDDLETETKSGYQQPVSVPLDRDVVFQEVTVLPGGETLAGDSGEPAGPESRLIYSNTLGIHTTYFPANQPVSDDIATTAADGCKLRYFKFKVLGKVLSTETAPRCTGGPRNGQPCAGSEDCPGGVCLPPFGPFTVTYGLYNNCPLALGSSAAQRDLALIPGTQGTIAFADDSPRTIKHIVDPHQPVSIPANAYLSLRFNRRNCGTVVGAPAMDGYSGDIWDFPGFICKGFLGGFPEFPHASFWAEFYGDAACPPSFPGYKAARASGETLLLGASVQGMDDIRLQVENCQMTGYEVVVRGVGFYTFDLRRSCDGKVIEGTERTFSMNASTIPLLQVARFQFDPPIPLLDDDLFVGFRCSSHNAGAVVAGIAPVIGESSSDLFTIGFEGCEPRIPVQGVHGAINLAITCAGAPPSGACCDMGLTQCVGGTDHNAICESYCTPPGTCDPVCREGPKMNCPISPRSFSHPDDMWIEGALCSSNPFVPACGVAACCKTDDTCENFTKSQCMATASGDDVVYWWETLDCESPQLECILNVCRDPDKTGDCSLARHEPGCSFYTGYFDDEGTSLESCCQIVCEGDRWCCDVEWDRQCVQRAAEQCILRPTFDACSNPSELHGPLEVDSNSTTHMNNIGASEYFGDPAFCCNPIGPGSPGFGSGWLKFVASHESVQIETCGSDQEGDSLFNLFAVADPASEDTSCNSLSLLGCGDDGCSATGRHARLCVDNLKPGSTYYLMLASKTPETKGTLQIQLKSPAHCDEYWSADDCNGNATMDGCDMGNQSSLDCNSNIIPDECDIADGRADDCNDNLVPDSCDIEGIMSHDCNGNTVPDECEILEGAFDCDSDGFPDLCSLFRSQLQYPGSSSAFAANIAMTDEWLFVGDAADWTTVNRGGRVHIYRHDGLRWLFHQTIQSSESAVGDAFGSSLAVSGDELFVGAPGFRSPLPTPRGSLYVFALVGGAWLESQILTPFGDGPLQFFGSSVASSGDDLAVGGFAGTTTYGGVGRVFMFVRDSDHWTSMVQLRAPTSDGNLTWYGSSLAMTKDYLFAGNPDAGDYREGAVHVYLRNENSWTLLQALNSPEGLPSPLSLGISLAASKSRVLAGAQDAVLSYERHHTKWDFQQLITSKDEDLRGFGASIAMSEFDAVVGAWASDSLDAGLAKTYHYENGNWTHTATLIDEQVPVDFIRHVDVAMSDRQIAIGTSSPDPPFLQFPPTVHVFALPPRDCNTNKLPDLCESNFSPMTDCNGNSTPDACEDRGFGDSDFSGREDLADFAGLQRCFLESIGALASCCRIFDAEPRDGDADLVDFAAFSETMTGP